MAATIHLGDPEAGLGEAVLGIAVSGKRVYATHHTAFLDSPHDSTLPGEPVELDRLGFDVLRRVTIGFQPRSVAADPARGKATSPTAGRHRAGQR